MSDKSQTDHALRLAALPPGDAYDFALSPDAEARAAIATELELLTLRKLTFKGQILPEGKRDWRLEGTLGATVVQPCVATLAPVTTRIDETLIRRYIADMPEPSEGSEEEIPDDDTMDPLPDVLDLNVVMIEALALALPLYPRAADAGLEQTTFAEPGTAPLTDDDVKPFAALAKLKNTLKDE